MRDEEKTKEQLLEELAVLRESEGRLRFLAENTGDLLYRLRYDSMSYDYLNPAIKRLTGYSSEEINTLRFSELVIKIETPGEGAISPDVIVKRRHSGNTGEFKADYLIRTKEGDLRWLRDHSFPWYDELGRLSGSVGVLSDITEYKRMEESLRESEDRYRRFFENCPISLLEQDSSACRSYLKRLLASGITSLKEYLLEHPEEARICLQHIQILDINQATVQMLGAESKGQVMGRYESFFLNESWEGVLKQLEGLVRERSDIEFETTIRAFDGDHRNVIVKVMSLPAEHLGRNIEIVSVVDITERKRTEEELLKVQKLESIGVLAGGIAHDFNNLLGMIMGNICLAQINLNPSDGAFRFLNEAVKACRHSRHLTQELITFSKGGAPVRKIESIQEILTGAIGLALAGSNMNYRILICDDLWPVDCDSGQIHQALMSVIINAKEASNEGGVIEVKAENVHLTKGEMSSLRGGRYVRVSVKDHGVGIPANLLSKIFDPYFSTKERGSRKGMGLGLTITYSIVKRHEGHVSVESKPGSGTTLCLYLPSFGGGALNNL
jgi:PAS domain S-box-containing protein